VFRRGRRRDQQPANIDTTEQEAARARIIAEAARQRAERDQAVPPEHRADEAERREAAARWNQPTRWLTPARLTLGQRYGFRVSAALADRSPMNAGRRSR
jgi:hypothetical protein